MILMNSIIHTIKQSKWKPIDVKTSSYIYFEVENNHKDPKFEVVDHERISKHFFLKVTPQIGQKKFLLLKKVKNTLPWT